MQVLKFKNESYFFRGSATFFSELKSKVILKNLMIYKIISKVFYTYIIPVIHDNENRGIFIS